MAKWNGGEALADQAPVGLPLMGPQVFSSPTTSHPAKISACAHDMTERHHNATSNGCPEHTNPEEVEGSNHEEEDGTPTARTPTATFHRTASCSLIRKHKGRSKQNATVSH